MYAENGFWWLFNASLCPGNDIHSRFYFLGREMDKHGLVVTTSGDSCQIPALFIIHVDATSVRRTFSKVNLAWRKMVLKCLQKAEQMKLTSLAFPALGTGK